MTAPAVDDLVAEHGPHRAQPCPNGCGPLDQHLVDHQVEYACPVCLASWGSTALSPERCWCLDPAAQDDPPLRVMRWAPGVPVFMGQ